ncbi:FadR family transcriptional regulator [Verminephrobacter aporrectodeae subsp. tuberculatae]|uniref:FadR/GntR family transcriptional regulator n=1 Tax=Verminephrobacter aporrectodeae TaxID=1110389 RepID=UPI0002376FA0|nr:FadR/GntR family transcriptional regulator [Verminephrobacter aporrectodeae]MCW8163821.1 FadR family transcriptional regulator [Verminephrobacter aporrectodeae subsp. tuberculatae]MCW8168056.1 FadR family transcriptional regulator [Verminephrobacter aporrectodeae subsp. tuberculatae]
MTLELVHPQPEQFFDNEDKLHDRAYLRLAASVHKLIKQGEFLPGQRLPSERALADRFGVSRTAVREAIIALELQGVVEVRGGSGIYVCQAQGAAVPPLPGARETGVGPFELLRARCLIESEVAAVAAVSRKDADLDRLFAALKTMREQLHDKAANEAADVQFHVHIAEASGNSVLRRTVQGLREQERGPLWTQIEQHFHSPELRQKSQEDHQQIFAAIVAGQAEAARLAMRAHLEQVICEFAQSWR